MSNNFVREVEQPHTYPLLEYVLKYDIVKKYLPDLFLLIIGLLIMALLIYLIASSHGWVSLVCILALAVVWISWYRHLLNMARKSLGVHPDDEDDLPSFPG